MIVVLAALSSAVMFYLSQGLANVWPLAWFAPVPLLWLAYGNSPRWQVYLASLAAFAAGQAYALQCYWRIIPLGIIAPLFLTMCATFPLAVLFSGEAQRRHRTIAALVAFPALWTAVEYGIGLASPHGTFGALGYAEVSFPAAIQVASLFGVHSVTFELCLAASAVALLMRRQWTAGAAGLCLCALALVFGFLRLSEPQRRPVAVVALADADSWHAESRERTETSQIAAARAYAAYIGRLSAVSVVAIPEGAIQMRESDQRAVLAPLASAARVSKAMVVAGTFIASPPQNRAFAFRPDGEVETYAKRHLLTPLETGTPGHTLGLLGGGYAVQICKDMDFPSSVRGTAEHGVRLMVVPANDFRKDGWIHARMAIMRGVEDGFAVVRSAFNGLETISDDRGRILAKARTMSSGMVVASADVPPGSGPTLYTRIGEAFSWLCVALSLLLGASVLGAKRSAVQAAHRCAG
jgi:apolipoprotein N-acyltransferase